MGAVVLESICLCRVDGSGLRRPVNHNKAGHSGICRPNTGGFVVFKNRHKVRL